MTITPTTSQLRMLASVKGHQWMVRPDAIQEFALAALDVPEKSNALNIQIEDFFEIRPGPSLDADGIGHIHIQSMLMVSCPAIYEKLGLVTRYSTIMAETSELIGRGAVAILFHVNSPGGTVNGNIEAAEFIRDLPVPSVAFCHGLACSAAYKLSAGCNAIVASPSAVVGNIGSIMLWTDCTEFWAQQGVEFKAMFSEGADLKSTGHLEPNAVQLAFLQEDINRCGESFRNHVIAGRETAGVDLDPEVFRAGWYAGEAAEALGLIDAVGDVSGAIAWLKTFLK